MALIIVRPSFISLLMQLMASTIQLVIQLLSLQVIQNTLFDIKQQRLTIILRTALIAGSKVRLMAIMPYYFASISDVNDDIVM